MLVEQKRARHKPSPSINLTRFYHARTCVRMTKAEVEGILADPQRAPDSDDEEDVEDWKVRPERQEKHFCMSKEGRIGFL